MIANNAVIGAILVGGSSRRMGVPKPGVVLKSGLTMVEHVALALGMFVERIVLVGRSEMAPSFPLQVDLLPDRERGAGPLAAIETLLASGIGQRYLIAACDQPLLRSQVLIPLLEMPDDAIGVLATDEGERLDPFPSIWPAAALDAVREYRAAGGRSVRDFLVTQSTVTRSVPSNLAACVNDFNTMEELLAWGLVAEKDGASAQTLTVAGEQNDGALCV